METVFAFCCVGVVVVVGSEAAKRCECGKTKAMKIKGQLICSVIGCN
jgi:hypothetical protein